MWVKYISLKVVVSLCLVKGGITLVEKAKIIL